MDKLLRGWFLVLAFLLLACGAALAELPWTTDRIAKTLDEAGFTMMDIQGNTFWMRAPGPVVAKLKLDGNGRVLVAGVGFYGKNMDAVYMAMVAYYVCMQADMGKMMSNDKSTVRAMVLKMRRLQDTIAHNLRLNPRTSFTFDDLNVMALKGGGGYIVIEFRPEWE